jgi:hypothetical protein
MILLLSKHILSIDGYSRYTEVGSHNMPIISMFYGIIVQLFFFDADKHKKAHIHVRYAEFVASIDIQTTDILDGDIPQRQLRMVQAWIEIHREELMADWALALEGNAPFRIEPLK